MTFPKLAEYYLLMREKGYSVRDALRYSWRVYAILGAVMLPALALFHFLEAPRPFWFMLGLTVAVPVRDIEFLRSAKKVWPFWIEVVDWNKVQAIADGTYDSLTSETR